MGVLAPANRRDRWAADPEALLLLTLELGRDDPRLLEEILDWLATNERLISVQRLRNLARDEQDRALVEASLGWVAQWRRRAPLAPKDAGPTPVPAEAKAFFRTATGPVEAPDRSFLANGFLKAQTRRTGKSRAPNLEAPINFAFRMRSLLGVGARAEVARVLLCSDAPRLSVQVVTESTAYAKRNAQEALSALRAAGVVSSTTLANEQRFEVPKHRWEALLNIPPGDLPYLEDWPQLFHALRLLLRWLHDPQNEQLTAYMRASKARVLLDEIAPELRFAGVRAYDSNLQGAEYWDHFTEVIRGAMAALR
jgi:hypothetical protein